MLAHSQDFITFLNSNVGEGGFGVEYRAFTRLDTEFSWYKSMCILHANIFSTLSSDSIRVELLSRPQFLILVANHDGRVVGYTIGCHER